MKNKTEKVSNFIDGLHQFILNNPQLRKDTSQKTEVEIQTELRPLIISYLEKYYQVEGYKDYEAKANKSFYWEGQEGEYGRERATIFGARNYPDFIIEEPYKIAIEYKQSPNGSVVKHGIGQSMMYTLSNDFDFVYYLFHDESEDNRIEKSIKNETETNITKLIWDEFNIYLRFI